MVRICSPASGLAHVPGDYSEQQLVDCGYDGKRAKGCNGAATFAYVKWAADSKDDLTAEVTLCQSLALFHRSSQATYPYKNTSPTLTCPTSLAHYNKGAKVRLRCD